MTTIALSTTTGMDGEYARALAGVGAAVRLMAFDPATIDRQLEGTGGIVLSGGGDVDPQAYGIATTLAAEIDGERDAFELALARYARDRGIPTLCICRGLQVANVAYGGTLVPDLAEAYGGATARRHRFVVDGVAARGILADHEVDVDRDSRLASIVGRTTIATGSRHHQSLGAVADGLRVVATTRDGIVEAAEARFRSPFWLGVQWHPESTLRDRDATSYAIFAAFVGAAERFAGEAVGISP